MLTKQVSWIGGDRGQHVDLLRQNNLLSVSGAVVDEEQLRSRVGEESPESLGVEPRLLVITGDQDQGFRDSAHQLSPGISRPTADATWERNPSARNVPATSAVTVGEAFQTASPTGYPSGSIYENGSASGSAGPHDRSCNRRAIARPWNSCQ
jgi:hypothetical protein